MWTDVVQLARVKPCSLHGLFFSLQAAQAEKNPFLSSAETAHTERNHPHSPAETAFIGGDLSFLLQEFPLFSGQKRPISGGEGWNLPEAVFVSFFYISRVSTVIPLKHIGNVTFRGRERGGVEGFLARLDLHSANHGAIVTFFPAAKQRDATKARI